MTLTELNRYLNLISDLAKTTELLENLKNASCPGAQVLTGMPHATEVRDKVGDFCAEIDDAEMRISYIKKEIKKQEKIIKKFVYDIDDFYTHTIFRLRFMKGYTWKSVARIVGGGNTEESVKSACYRYLKKLHRDDAS